MRSYKILYNGGTHPGMQRTNNEDAYIQQTIWDERHLLSVVIDGVGGYEGGERAAEIAQDSIIAYLNKSPNGERLDLLKQAVTEANNKIYEERNSEKQFPNMSCVLTACLVELEKEVINMVHVGDTRLYQFRRNELKKLSHDHSLVGYREEIGNLTEEEAMHHPERNMINRLVGDKLHEIDDCDFLEADTFPLSPNTTLMLCSDGLFDMITSAEISSVLNQEIPLDSKVDNLIQLANEKGGNDNITVALIEYIEDSDEQQINKREEESLSHQTVNETPKKSGKNKISHDKQKTNSLLKQMLFVLIAFLLGFSVGWFMNKIIY